MKTKGSATLLLALALAGIPALAQESAAGGQVQPLKVLSSDVPVFPQQLVQSGVREGEVRVAFSVDPQGRVDDVLAIEYTHPEFARVSTDAIRRWKFEPARYRGQPVASASEVSIQFMVQGTVVVSLTPTELLSLRINSLTTRDTGSRPRGLKELDRIPIPISTKSPGFPERLAKSGTEGQVTVEFYIDETGAVRLPSIEADSDPELGAVAIDALRTWKFEPPTCKGRPVLVRASQRFDFRQPKKAPAATAGS